MKRTLRPSNLNNSLCLRRWLELEEWHWYGSQVLIQGTFVVTLTHFKYLFLEFTALGMLVFFLQARRAILCIPLFEERAKHSFLQLFILYRQADTCMRMGMHLSHDGAYIFFFLNIFFFDNYNPKL